MYRICDRYKKQITNIYFSYFGGISSVRRFKALEGEMTVWSSGLCLPPTILDSNLLWDIPKNKF